MFLLAMQTASQDGVWNTATIIGLFVGSGLTLLVFIAWEWHRGDQAVIPGKVVLRRTVLFTCIFAFTQMGGLTVATYYLPAWFQAIQGVGPLQSGVRILPTVITQMLATMFASSLGGRLFFLPLLFVMSRSVADLGTTSSETQVLQSVVLHRPYLHVHI